MGLYSIPLSGSSSARVTRSYTGAGGCNETQERKVPELSVLFWASVYSITVRLSSPKLAKSKTTSW